MICYVFPLICWSTIKVCLGFFLVRLPQVILKYKPVELNWNPKEYFERNMTLFRLWMEYLDIGANQNSKDAIEFGSWHLVWNCVTTPAFSHNSVCTWTGIHDSHRYAVCLVYCILHIDNHCCCIWYVVFLYINCI